MRVDAELLSQIMIALSAGGGAVIANAATGVGAGISEVAKSTIVRAGEQLRSGLMAIFRKNDDEDSVTALEAFDASPDDDGARAVLAERLQSYDLASQSDVIDVVKLINEWNGALTSLGQNAVASPNQTNHAETGGVVGNNFSGPVHAGYNQAKPSTPGPDGRPDPQ